MLSKDRANSCMALDTEHNAAVISRYLFFFTQQMYKCKFTTKKLKIILIQSRLNVNVEIVAKDKCLDGQNTSSVQTAPLRQDSNIF